MPAKKEESSEEKKEITVDEVAKHNQESDCWIIIGNPKTGGPKVYDVTKYLDEHPGGAEVMMEFAGGDADGMFEDIGHSKDARKTMAEYFVGTLKDDGSRKAAAPSSSDGKKELESKGGLSPVAIIVFIIAILLGVYFSQQK